MNKINKQKILITMLLISSFCISVLGQGQMGDDYVDQPDPINIIPTTPQAAALGSYSNQGINGASGTPLITIPIYTIEEDGVSVPIYLSYDASGIRVEDISTEVGLKWNLNIGGSVSRVIRGLADDELFVGWFNNTTHPFPDNSWNNNSCYNLIRQEQMDFVATNNLDVLPDSYNYAIGNKSGSFYFKKNRSVRKIIEDDIKIVAKFTRNQPSYKLTGFELTDNTGVKYLFGEGSDYIGATHKTSYVQRGGLPNSNNQPRSGNGDVEWKLNKITTRNGKSINFYYDDYQIEYTMNNNHVKRIDKLNASGGGGVASVHITDYAIFTKLPSMIETENIKVEFGYEDHQSANLWKKKLTTITITFKGLPNNKKCYQLNYGVYSGCSKLRLDQIIEMGTENDSGKTWEFKYKSGNIPDMNSKNFDFFGYYNNANNSNYVAVSYTNPGYISWLNDRNINSDAISIGNLIEIIYPTGGKTNFYYEPNKCKNINNQDIYAAGVRVSKIEDIESNGNGTTKKYFYSGMKGRFILADDNNFKWYFCKDYSDNKTLILYTTPNNTFNQISGVCYETVEIWNCEYNKIEPFGDSLYNCRFKEIEIYNPYVLNNKVHPKIIEKQYFDENNNDPIKKSIYNYTTTQTIPSSSEQGWQVIEDYIVFGHINYCNSNAPFEGGLFYSGLIDEKHYSYKDIQINSINDTEYYGNTSISRSQSFLYNSNYQLREHKILLQNNDYYYTEYTYPNSDNYEGLYNKHIIGLPLTKTVYNKNIVNDKRKYDYDSNGNLTKMYDFANVPPDYIALKEEYSYYSGSGSGNFNPTNMFDINNPSNLYNYYINSSGELVYCFGEGSGPGLAFIYNTTHPIEVFEGENYVAGKFKIVAFYDSNNIFIEGSYINLFESVNMTLTAPLNAKWVRFSVLTSDGYNNYLYWDYFNVMETIEDGVDIENIKWKLKEVAHSDGTYTTYLWGYLNKFPIAEIKNANFSNVCVAIGNGNETVGSNMIVNVAKKIKPSASDWQTINNLRNIMPEAMITTYKYKPLSGIESITDPNGITTLYNYDDFGRLEEIKVDGKTVETYIYNYKSK